MSDKKEYAVTVEEHKCKMLENCEIVWISKIKYKGVTNWHWNFRRNGVDIECHEIEYCPYCGRKLVK